MKAIFFSLVLFLLPYPTFSQTVDEVLDEDEESYACPLKDAPDGKLTIVETGDSIGAEDPRVCLYLKSKNVACVQLKGGFNSAFPVIRCIDYDIEIFSERNAQASTFHLTYFKKVLELKKGKKEDMNQSSTSGYEAALKKGDITAAVREIGSVLYPSHNLNQEGTCLELMETAHKFSVQSLRSKKWRAVITKLKPAWDWCAENNVLAKSESLAKQKAFVLAANDYGYALEQSRNYKDAESVLKKVLEIEKNRSSAYLNLGDALAGQKKDSAAAYDKYCTLVPAAKWPKRIVKISPACKK